MIESRKTTRRAICYGTAFLESDEARSPRKIFNLSMGGMLLERLSCDVALKEKSNISITILVDEEKLSLPAEILRKQERSIAVRFVDLSLEDRKALDALF